MSFGGGAQGTIRYALIVDDAQATQKLNTFKTNLNSVGASTNTLNKNMGALGNNFKNTTGGLTQQNTLLGQTIKQHQTLGNTIKTNASRFAGLATGLSATASGALQLAAGFRDYNDAQIAVDRVTRRLSLGQEALGKAQAKLNALNKSGSASSADLAQAQLDVEQAQKQVEIQTQLVGEAQERMFDSQTQFVASIVPTVLGAVGSLGFAFKEFSGTLGKLPAMFKEGGAAAKLFSSDLGLIGIAATASVAIALLVIDTVQKARDKWKQLGVEFTESSIFDTKKMATSQAEWDEIVKRTSASTLDWAFNQEQVLKKFKEMGGVLDKTGKIMVTVQDRSFGIADAFKKNGETTATWIGWMRIYREQGESNAEIMARLTKAGFDNATATKIAAAANEDYNNKVKAGIPIITQSAAEVKKATDAFIEQDEILGKMTEIKLRQYMLGWENAMAEVIVTTKDNTRQAMTTSGAEIAEGMRTGIAALDVVLQKEAGNATNAAVNEMLGIIATRGPEWSKAIADHWTVWTPEVEQAFDEVMKTANTSANKIADDQKKAADESAKAWQDFQKESRTQLFTTFDVKTPEDQKQKFLDKIRKALPDKVEKKIELILKAQAKEEGFKAGAAALIAGLAEEIKGDEKLADAVIKGIASKAPKGALKDWLNSILDAPDSGEQVVENIQKFADANPVEVPVTPKFTTAAENKSIWAKSAAVMKLFEIPATAKVDDVVIGNGVDPGQTAFDANPYTATIDTIQFSPKMGLNPAEGAAVGEAISGAVKQAIAGGNLEKARKQIWDFLMLGPQKRAFEGLTSNKTGGANWLAGLGKGPNPTGGANWLAGQQMGKPQEMVLKVNNTQAIKAVDVVAKRIASLSTIPAMIKLINTTAIKATDVVAKRIFSLTGLQPSISLQNKKAIKANDVVANRIDSLTKIKPSISLQNNKAIKAVDVVANRIQDLSNISPTIHVSLSGPGAKFTQHGFKGWVNKASVFVAGEAGPEFVSVTPAHKMGGASSSGGVGGDGTGQLVVNLTNVIADKEITRTFRRELGKELYRFGPT